MMIRSIVIASTSLLMWVTHCAAATITADTCGQNCLMPSYEHVEITLTGRIERGDLANIQRHYAAPAQFLCLKRIEPGRYDIIPADKLQAWQKQWRHSHPTGTHPTDQTTQ